MRKIILLIISLVLTAQQTFASSSTNSSIFGNFSFSALRTGNIHIEDIPGMIKGAIDFLMGIAGTVAIIFIIVGAYKILFSGFEGDKSQGKNTIVMAIGGFVLASLAWFIIRFIIENIQKGSF